MLFYLLDYHNHFPAFLLLRFGFCNGKSNNELIFSIMKYFIVVSTNKVNNTHVSVMVKVEKHTLCLFDRSYREVCKTSQYVFSQMWLKASIAT